MAKRKSIIPGFSWNRALGITSAKQKIARATGIPTTKQGRKRKLQSSLWTAVAFGAVASAASKPQALTPEEAARCQEIKENGRRTRRNILIAVAVICIIFYIIVNLFPGLVS